MIDVYFYFPAFFYIYVRREKESLDPDFEKGFDNLNNFLYKIWIKDRQKVNIVFT